MADRRTLAISNLEDFKKWLINKGYTIEQTKGCYEVLRARKLKNLVIIYKKSNSTVHCSVQDKDIKLIKMFIKEKGDNKNGSYIK